MYSTRKKSSRFATVELLYNETVRIVFVVVPLHTMIRQNGPFWLSFSFSSAVINGRGCQLQSECIDIRVNFIYSNIYGEWVWSRPHVFVE